MRHRKKGILDKRGAMLIGFFKKKPTGTCYSQLSSMLVKDIMIKDVLCAQRAEKLSEAAHMMIGAHASCLVVLEGEKPTGIITERDFIKKLPMEGNHADDMIVNDL